MSSNILPHWPKLVESEPLPERWPKVLVSKPTAACCPDCLMDLKIGDWPMGCKGTKNHKPNPGGFGTLNSAIHTSERATIFRNPRTGEVRIPASDRQPMAPQYAAQGYVREEISTHQQRKQLERETGKIQESAYFDNGSGGAERSLTTGLRDAPPIRGLDDSSH